MKFRLKAFILAIILSASIITVKNVYSWDLTGYYDRGLKRVINLGTVDRLYIGSSLVRKGINIAEAEKYSQSGFLLHYGSLDPLDMSMLLEIMLQHGLVIENLYIDMHTSAAVPYHGAEGSIFFEVPLSMRVKIFQLIMQNSGANFLKIGWEVFVSDGNEKLLFWPLYKTAISRAYYKGGYPEGYVRPGTTREILDAEENHDNNPGIDVTQKRGILKIIKLCKENNINLAFLELPKYSAKVNNSIYQKFMTEYISLINENGVKCIISAELLKQLNIHENDKVISYEFNHDNPEYFTDQIHLSSEGSIALMKSLTKVN